MSKGKQKGGYGWGGMSERKVAGAGSREVEVGLTLQDRRWTLSLTLRQTELLEGFEQNSDVLLDVEVNAIAVLGREWSRVRVEAGTSVRKTLQ